MGTNVLELAAGLAILAGFSTYLFLIRPWQLRWGGDRGRADTFDARGRSRQPTDVRCDEGATAGRKRVAGGRTLVQQDDITLPVTGGRHIRAHLARPAAGQSPVPGVLVLHEILGLNDDIRRIAGRFASEGYAALAPDIFDGLGPMPICVVRTVAAISRGQGSVYRTT